MEFDIQTIIDTLGALDRTTLILVLSSVVLLSSGYIYTSRTASKSDDALFARARKALFGWYNSLMRKPTKKK